MKEKRLRIRTLRIYREDGVKLEREKLKEEVKDLCSGVYRKHRNDKKKVWITEKRKDYMREYEQGKKT